MGLLKQKWLWITGLFAVINITGLTIIHSEVKKGRPVLTVEISPTGKQLSVSDSIRVNFSQPVASRAEIDKPVPAELAGISPKVDGGFVWTNQSSCRLVTDTPLRLATRYQVTLDPGITSLSGLALQA